MLTNHNHHNNQRASPFTIDDSRFTIFAFKSFAHEHQRLDRNNWSWNNIDRVFLQHVQLDVGTQQDFLFTQFGRSSNDMLRILSYFVLAIFRIGRNMGNCVVDWLDEGERID